MQIFLGIWTISVAGGIKPKQVEEKNEFVFTEKGIEGAICGCGLEESNDLVENPCIELCCVCLLSALNREAPMCSPPTLPRYGLRISLDVLLYYAYPVYS